MQYRNQMRRIENFKLIMALGAVGIVGATLSSRADAQANVPETATLPAAPPAVTSPEQAPPATTPGAEAGPVLVIAANELRLDGTVAAVNVEQNTLTLDVSSFTLPTGNTQALAAPKPKTIVLTPRTWLHPVNDATQKVTLAEVAMGTVLVVIGKDAGTGRALTAREIGTEPTVAVPVAGDATGTTAPGTAGDVTEAPDVAALRQALTIRITQLQAELQQLKTTPDVYSKAQINDLVASLRREFEANLQNLSKRITTLEAAAHRGGPETAVTPPVVAPPVAPVNR